MEFKDTEGIFDEEAMNIYAEKEHQIVFTNTEAGYPHHQKTAKRYLELGKIYTVECTKVGDWHTDVYLTEVPDVAFNSVMFDNLYNK